MGGHCSKEGIKPDTSNVCSSSEDPSDNTTSIPGFCAPINFFGGIDKRREYCARIGDDEWEYDSQGDDCNYNDCQIPNAYHGACCKGCCGVVGRGVICRRKEYKGNPLKCCFRDLDQNRSGNFCFETDSEQKTCKPSNRSITSDNCQDNVTSYCLGRDLAPDDISWFDRWTEDGVDGMSCLYALRRNLFGNPNVPGLTSGVPLDPSLYTNAEGFQWSKRLLTQVFNKYREQGFVIGALPGFKGYDDFQTQIFSLCSTTPGLCEEGLNLVCSPETTESLLFNPELVPWCGCFLPNQEYQTYTDEFQINKECTPICARQGNIQVPTSSGTAIINCDQDVCVIDDVTISLARTDVGGDINFSQFCGGCSGPAHGMATSSSNIGNTGINIQKHDANSSTCNCFITNINIDTASSRIGGDIDLSQTCGNSTCYRENPQFGQNSYPEQIEVPCDAPNNYDPLQQEMEREKEEEEARFRRNVIIGSVILVVLIIVMLIFFFADLGGNHVPVLIPRPKPPVPWATISQVGSRSIYQRGINLAPGARSFAKQGRGPGYAGSIR